MCGRLACRQRQAVYQQACAYKEGSTYIKPELVDLENNGKSFTPSANLCPSEASPVIVANGQLVDGDCRQMASMIWGVIPPWHKGDIKSHGLTTNNCRIETAVTSKLYGPLLKNGNRCIVICDGFYEWQTANKSKQPYFIYSKQSDEQIKIEDCNAWESGKFDAVTGWSGLKPLYMAGLYSIWHSEEGNEVYSYTVITKESDSGFSWLHHRVPCFLSDELAKGWLTRDNLTMDETMSLLNQAKSPISYHPVSTAVNNAKNKSESCNQRIKLKNTLLTSWLKRSSSMPSTAEKKPKIDENL